MMPSVNRVTNHKSTTKLKGGSILDEAIDVADLEDDFIKMVIYGGNRVGKTTLACTFPKPLLLIPFEPAASGGARSVKKVEGVKLQPPVRSTEHALALARALSDDMRYSTVVIDSATSLQDVVLKELMGLDDTPVQLNWGLVSSDQYRQRSEKTKELLRPFLSLPCHVVVIAKEKDHNPPENRKEKAQRQAGMRESSDGLEMGSFLASDLGGATVGWLHDACDYIGRLYLDKETRVERKTIKVNGKPTEQINVIETGKIVRRLRTMYHPNIAAGFRSENPQAVPEFIEAPSFEKILKVIQGKKLEEK